jgi:hypothetical protein
MRSHLFPDGLSHIEQRMRVANAKWLEVRKVEQERTRLQLRLELARRLR